MTGKRSRRHRKIKKSKNYINEKKRINSYQNNATKYTVLTAEENLYTPLAESQTGYSLQEIEVLCNDFINLRISERSANESNFNDTHHSSDQRSKHHLRTESIVDLKQKTLERETETGYAFGKVKQDLDKYFSKRQLKNNSNNTDQVFNHIYQGQDRSGKELITRNESSENDQNVLARSVCRQKDHFRLRNKGIIDKTIMESLKKSIFPPYLGLTLSKNSLTECERDHPISLKLTQYHICLYGPINDQNICIHCKYENGVLVDYEPIIKKCFKNWNQIVCIVIINDNHLIAFMANKSSGTSFVANSSQPSNTTVEDDIGQQLSTLISAHTGTSLTYHGVVKCPQQKGQHDCGIYLCSFAKQYFKKKSHNNVPDFSEPNVPNIRNEMRDIIITAPEHERVYVETIYENIKRSGRNVHRSRSPIKRIRVKPLLNSTRL